MAAEVITINGLETTQEPTHYFQYVDSKHPVGMFVVGHDLDTKFREEADAEGLTDEKLADVPLDHPEVLLSPDAIAYLEAQEELGPLTPAEVGAFALAHAS